ncbi:MAG: NTP transferase domain-containing protein [Odoribacteraceae bacterium]|jgi:NDP-sugar pyrophosphorylase family protein|nr:NTP transferase domain-containing protein [Odoribacteraceae bacterium]
METFNKKTTLLIMAAGLGSRFGGLKQMALLGPRKKTLLHYSIHDAVQAGFDKIVFVIRDSFASEFREAVGRYAEERVETRYCFQDMNRLPGGLPPVEREKPWGTAHAIWSAREAIDEPFAAINADDFYGGDAFAKVHDFLARGEEGRCFGLAGYRLAATLSENGSVARGVCSMNEAHFLTKITEMTKIARDGEAIRDLDSGTALQPDNLVSMNFWGFQPFLFEEIERQFADFYRENSQNPKSEIYIPLVVDEMLKQQRVKVKVLDIDARWFGVTYKEDAALVNAALEGFEAAGLYTDL